MLLKINQLTKSYKINREEKFPALKGVDLEFNKGEMIAVIGESGSGKSTLMNVLGGLDKDYQGQVLFQGKDLKGLKEKELDKYRKNQVGFIFQSFNLIPHLSVLDNITIAMTLSNIGKEERTKRAKEILKEVGLEDQMKKKPNQLSGGQKQRVAIARALINDPEIILADEPTGSLDSETSAQIMKIIEKIADQGKLVIIVTHSERVAKNCNRIVEIADGLIIKDQKNNDSRVLPSEKKSEKGKQNLSFMSAIGLSFKNMREKLTRNILVALGASIGITSVIIMLSIGNGVEKYITNTMNEFVNPLVVEVNKKSQTTDTTTQNPGSIMMAATTPFTDEEIAELAQVKDVKEVEKAYAKTSFNSFSIQLGEEKKAFQSLATLSKNVTSENITEGDMPEAGEILISASLNEQYAESLIGKEVILNTEVGGKKLEGTYVVSGLFGEISSMMSNINIVYLNYGDLESMAVEAGAVIEPNTVYLSTDKESKVQGIKDTIKEMGYEGSIQEQLLEMFTEMLSVMTYILSAIAAISLVVSAIMILVVLYISVVERTKEIGVLKAIGARRKDIKRIFVAEAFLIGLVSGLIGILVAVLMMLGINFLTNKLYEVDLVVISVYYALFGLGVSIVISVLAGLYPAAKGAKLDPVESLRRE